MTSARIWLRSFSPNNGYRVINLGIKVAPDALIEAWREHHPDAIGFIRIASGRARTRW